MHAELLRRSAQKIVLAETEKERKRKLEELERLVRGEAENENEIAQTSENLSKVQNDLKNSFKIAAVSAHHLNHPHGLLHFRSDYEPGVG